ncbi:hypothetical protein T552_04130 [Pneumocystis carinii B80]|uniref:N(6)-L-threonylcarbamoyladenine synthase n=1 Tax=Pneumocystis carinii (strain B80) TaxID=1408658 RepID=A0A0W4ZJF9_PNEC8|nr:hypothetical protein T552_04130 [Pneumocystis carinii B80]KTW28499.1 hypothetical protein T552_04130 [Pneumocystis carinii B80]
MIFGCRNYWGYFFPRKILSFYRELRILAIETSCDDTSVCLLENCIDKGFSEVLYHKTERSLSENEKFGGIHPEVSIVYHQKKLSYILKEVFDEYICGRRNIDLIAVTQGPGMIGSLSVGLNTAKGLSVALDVPLIGIHHMQAHSLTPRLISSGKYPEFPYLSLLLSGGHTLLVRSRSVIEHDILASTLDISVGDMIDKCARLLKVDWNGMMPGQALENWSKSGDPSMDTDTVWNLPEPLMKNPENRSKLAFSFSGLGSSVDRIVKRSSFNEFQLKSLARSLQISAFNHISRCLLLGLEKIDGYVTGIVISGGVARNSFLKTILHTKLNNSPYKHIPLFFPPTELCSDNSAMIAWTAYEMYSLGYISDLSILPIRKWPIDQLLELGKYIVYDN